MAVRYYNDRSAYRLPRKRLIAAWLGEVARQEGYSLGQVCYVFCSAARLLEMNRQYLGHDYYTDVITFDYSDRRGSRTVAGDVFIDVETVADNARRYGATKTDEMHRVIVHGLLHLCGQKDKTPRTNAAMHRKEDRYLALLGCMATGTAAHSAAGSTGPSCSSLPSDRFEGRPERTALSGGR